MWLRSAHCRLDVVRLVLVSYDTIEERPTVNTRSVTANEVRLPDMAEGEAVIVERYGKPYAAVIGAEEFKLFQRLLAMFGERQPSELSLSDAELAVHRSSEAGEDVEAFDFALLETHPA